MHRQFDDTRQQFHRRLYSYAWYSLRIAEDAEDVVQEAFVKLWEHWHEVDPLQVGAWLMRVTQNLIVDHVRRQKSRLPTSAVDADQLAQEAGSEPDLQEQHLLKRIVEESIARLGDPYRTIVIMREIQGQSYQDIAEILCISLDHVKTDLFRGKRKLRALVRQHPLYQSDLLTD